MRSRSRSIEAKILNRIEREEKRQAELAHMRALVNFNSADAYEGWSSRNWDSNWDWDMDERY